jgi:Flp pilus assembly pilin Flp
MRYPLIRPVLNRQPDRGATLVEYSLLVALIAVVSLGTISAAEDSSRDHLDDRGSSIGGSSEDIGIVPVAGSTDDEDDDEGDEEGDGTTTYDATVQNMTGTATNGSPSSKWIAQVVITVVDASGNPINGITVSGSWDTAGTPAGECTTDSNGSCTVQRNDVQDSKTTATFMIASMSSTDPDIIVNYTVPTPPNSYTVDCQAFSGSC